MQPLSPRVRARYLYTFISLFLVILPVAIFYADGWRWGVGLGFYKTGGIFISVPYQDANVSVNGKQIGRSGFFNRSFYVSDLSPDAYAVTVEREDYLPWTRVVVVEPQLVTDTEALLFPKRIEPVRLMVTGTATTGIEIISRAQYDARLEAFATTTLSASTTLPQDESDGMGLFVRGGDVFARWMSEDAFPSSRFCGRPSFCVREFTVERDGEEVRTARFFRGGVAYVTMEGKVYFTEADIRPSPVTFQLFEADDADIRVVDDSLTIKTGNTLYEISF